MDADICFLCIFMLTGKGNKQVLANNDEISLALKKNKGKSAWALGRGQKYFNIVHVLWDE